MAHSEGYCSVSEILISPKSVRMLNRSTGLVNPVNYTCQSELAVTAIRIPARDAGRMQVIDGGTFRRPSLASECVFFPIFVYRGRSESWTRVSGERAAPGQRDSTSTQQTWLRPRRTSPLW